MGQALGCAGPEGGVLGETVVRCLAGASPSSARHWAKAGGLSSSCWPLRNGVFCAHSLELQWKRRRVLLCKGADSIVPRQLWCSYQ